MVRRIALYTLLASLSSPIMADNMPTLTFVTPSIVRVQWSPGGITTSNATGVCTYTIQPVKTSRKESKSTITYRSKDLRVEIDRTSGALTFLDARTGRILLAEASNQPREEQTIVQEKVIYDETSARAVQTANGQVIEKDILRRDTVSSTHRYRCRFRLSPDEALYGLGAHMEDFMNLRGKTQYLVQHNLKSMVPVLQSTAGYGLLFDAGCSMVYSDSLHTDGSSTLSFQMEAAKEVDYYFMKGSTMDDVVAQYHYLTGGVPMMPRYMTGYVQSRERYVSSEDILNNLREFRKRHIPIDMIVQDWNYWPQGWGYAKMDRKHYPDPKALADEVHALNARLMISVWPNPQGCPEEDYFRREGLLLAHNAYDAFSQKGRDMYWKLLDEEFFSQGFDAWWCDCSEPVDGDWNRIPKNYGWNDHRKRWELNTQVLTEVCGAERANLYSLYHSRGIYEHQRATDSSKRVVNLTRSSYAGQQRYATINWNGDTHASWASFKRQIPAGLNYMATGNPYWTVDAGCFFTRSDGRWFWAGEFPQGNNDPAYREFYVRMLQWATFLPVMRSHGTDTRREPWYFGERGTVHYDAILDMINLRYRLTPYIYSMMAMLTQSDYTIARLLAFDFPHDKKARELKDEYMFGRILVCPVTDPGVTSRSVYLPGGEETQWYNFWTGKTYAGGQTIEAEAPVNRLPLFVRGGSVIPTTEVAEYTDAQVGKPITLQVYPGANASFLLYEDEGDNYNYEKGNFATIQVKWEDSRRTLLIDECKGQYKGMPSQRTFIVRTPWGEKEIKYVGKKISLKVGSIN